jgi:hypothetical protein
MILPSSQRVKSLRSALGFIAAVLVRNSREAIINNILKLEWRQVRQLAAISRILLISIGNRLSAARSWCRALYRNRPGEQVKVVSEVRFRIFNHQSERFKTVSTHKCYNFSVVDGFPYEVDYYQIVMKKVSWYRST